MTSTQPAGDYATPTDVRLYLLHRSAKRKSTPLRCTFVQQPPPAGRPGPSVSRAGPLATFVTNGDLRGLLTYLLVVGMTSSENTDGWSTTLENQMWARAAGTIETTGAGDGSGSEAANAAVYRIFRRLEERKLITRTRVARRDTRITLLREDGTGKPYTRPGAADADRYLQLPHAFWKHTEQQPLSIAAVAMLLVASCEPSGFKLPAERSKRWYGWSPDTTEKGFAELEQHGLITIEKRREPSASSPTGQTSYNTYRLTKPYRHVGRKRTKKKT